MKYRGRVTLITLSLVTSFILAITTDDANLFFFVFSLMNAFVSWIFGGFYDKVQYLSFHDPLTGVFNRRYAYKVFKKKFHPALLRNEYVGILMIDVNDFKKYNDTYGHDYGDFVLKEMSLTIQKSIDYKDILIRWGGDEFLVLFFKKDKSYAEQLIKEISERVNLVEKKCAEEEETFPSLSIGYSLYPDDATDISQLIAIADKKMYHVKRKVN